MPRRAEPYEVVQLNVAVIRKGGTWKIVDAGGNVLAGVRDKAVAAAMSGEAATAEEIKAAGEWMQWSGRQLAIIASRASSQRKSASDWGRKFQAMACSISRRDCDSDKRCKRRHAKDWPERFAIIAESLRCRSRRGGFDEWDLWAETCSRSINNREAQRKSIRKRAKESG